MSWLTKIALKKRWLTFLIVALVTGASIWAAVTLKMELIPDIELPVTSVVTVYPQAKPEEVMNKITVPVEGAIADIGGLKDLISTSSEGSSFTFAMFEYGTDMDRVNSIISQNLSKLDLPPEVRNLPAQMPQLEANPQLYAIDINILPVVMLSLSGDLPPHELLDIAITKVIPRLQAIEGVYHVGVEGGNADKVLVTLDAKKMNEFSISMSQVGGILASQQYSSLSQIENTALGTDALLLKDVARVNLGPPPGTAISRTNGNPSVSISVMKDAEANTVWVANAVVDEAKKIEANLGGKVKLLTVLDQSEFIERSISELVREAVIGAILAIIVVFLFLMAFRASLVTAVSIPLSILIGLLVMSFWGITINILTLSALAIAVGRVIDDSIVVLEVIYRHLKQGEGFKEGALNGAKEVATPITAATLATVVIFLPLAFVGGIVGELFVPFAFTVAFALIASLLVALMVVPSLSSFAVSGKAETKEEETWYQRIYTPVLKWSLAHRTATLVIAAALFFGSFALLPFIGTTFIPSMSEKTLTVGIEMPPGADLITTQDAAMRVEKVLGKNPEVLTYQTTAGTSSSLMGGLSSMMGGATNAATITVVLNPDADLEKEAADLRRACQGLVEEGTVTVSMGQAMMPGMMGSGVNISIRGESYEDIATTAQQLLSELEDMAGIADLEVDITSVEPKLDITPDSRKLMTSGLPPEQLQQIQNEFFLMRMGGTVAQANLEGRTYEVFLKGIAQDLDSAEMARELRVGWPKSVALGDIAAVDLGEQPTSIQRIDQKLAASITASITEEDVGAVNTEVQKKINALSLPSEVEVTMGGMAEMMGESFSSMFIAIIVAIVLAYAVVVVTFRSFLTPLIIMASLPLASIGALLGLLVTGRPLGISALMGILMLVGVVLTNAIVLIALVEQLSKRGMSTYDALIEGGRTRLRPILMTALATMLAMFPLALGLGEGTIMAAELAVVVIGGLFSSTLLTLLVIPVIYSFVEGVRRHVARLSTS
ncbi:MAG: hypothetical protein A2Y60_03855 [Chloroflexi bacterium RBG_13_54_9]|nr:MAG: hypothetical protein A2Y60_03855 [Chloroflexi bacterium RBG_13_54_9]